MTETIDCMGAPKCNAVRHFQRIEVVSIESGRRVVDLGPTYTAKPYASWPGYT